MQPSLFRLALYLCPLLILVACGRSSLSAGGPPAQSTLESPATIGAASPWATLPPTEKAGIPLNEPTIPATKVPQLMQYKGTRLPPPEPIKNSDIEVALPAMWLIAGGEVVAGSPGSYTYQTEAIYACPDDAGYGQPGAHGECDRMTHADAAPPDETIDPDLAGVQLPDNEQPSIVAATRSIHEFGVAQRRWSENPTTAFPPAWHEVQAARVEYDGPATVYAINPTGGRDTQLLKVSVALEGNSEITCYWRLNPTH